MKKGFKYYLGVWAVLFVLFNVIAFVSPGWITHDKYTASFWIGYAFITIAFIIQIICAFTAFKAENLQKLFYNIPLIRISYTGLILSFIVGGLCMLISPLPYWVGAILCIIVLLFNINAVFKASAAADLVGDIDDKVKAKTLFIKLLTADAESLLAKAQSEEIKAECKKVYEAVRYSDPMGHEALSGIESEITLKFAALTEAVEANNIEAVQATAKDVLLLIEDRNKKCKVLK